MEFVLILIDALQIILNILQWVVFVWVIFSWILFFMRQSQFRWRHRQMFAILEQLDDLFERMTRPFLRPIRRMLRRIDTAGIDWSPMVLMLIIWLLARILSVIRMRLIL
jgi:uncharacterized protein YggT (Ycf19 family)